MVKLVRVLANLAIHTGIGPRLGVTPGIEKLVDLLGKVELGWVFVCFASLGMTHTPSTRGCCH